jgi:hypothetical protein
LSFALRSLYCLHMRIILLLVLAGGAGWGGGGAVGVWKLSPGRSTFAADRQPRSLTLRIERHSRGTCGAGSWMRVIRRVATDKDLVLQVNDRPPMDASSKRD